VQPSRLLVNFHMCSIALLYMYSNKSANKPVKFMQQRAAAASARDRCGYKLCSAHVDLRLERCARSGNARSGACERNAATRRQSSGCFCCTYPAAHVSDTRMASARRSTGARLTFINHSLTLVCAAHLHGLEPRDTVLAIGARLVDARTRLARAQLAKPVQNVTKGSGQWSSCGARRRKNTLIIGGGGGIGCCCCHCCSRDGISTDI
jgi:hypothetical protein